MILWELIYSFAAVRLTTGQEYKFFYDENVYTMGANDMYGVVKDALSYDIRKLGYESLDPEYNVLSARLSIQEGDIIFTDSMESENGVNRINWLIDGYSICDIDKLKDDCIAYLSGFLAEGKTDYTDFDNLDKEKIKADFDKRVKSERSYKNSYKAGLIDEQDEYDRIENLTKELKDFITVIAKGDEIGLFYKYTRFYQSYNNADEKEKQSFEELYKSEIEKGKENLKYGINLSKLKNGETDISELVRVKSDEITDASNTVLAVFDFKDYQPELQYESISVINAIVRKCSDILA